MPFDKLRMNGFVFRDEPVRPFVLSLSNHSRPASGGSNHSPLGISHDRYGMARGITDTPLEGSRSTIATVLAWLPEGAPE